MTKYRFWKFLNIIAYALRIVLIVVSVICWIFVVNNIINRIVPEYIYLLASKDNALGHILLWLINNVYLKHMWTQYVVIFLQAKSFYIAILVSMLVRPVGTFVNFTHRHLVMAANAVKSKYATQLMREQAGRNVSANNQQSGQNMAQMQMAYMQTQLENERLKNQLLQNQLNAVSGSQSGQ